MYWILVDVSYITSTLALTALSFHSVIMVDIVL